MAFPNELLDSLSAPVGDLIASVGRSVADAQQAMDTQSVATFKSIYGDDGSGDERLLALRQLGYQPTWYQIPEVSAELNVALSITGEGSQQGSATGARGSKLRLYGAPVDASYANKYGFELKAASVIRFKIVPVPPSPAAEGMRVVPSLVGKKLGDVKQLLGELDIPFSVPAATTEPTDAAVIQGQVPAAGAVLTGGDGIELSFGS